MTNTLTRNSEVAGREIIVNTKIIGGVICSVALSKFCSTKRVVLNFDESDETNKPLRLLGSK